ncbi:HAD family hydrolase [Halalkalibacter sp. AB-rgal2]|uniref:HAD family hydrolase n=1 Tax=Halalkalibacter sp. AB-rgal2 TaxID=3242695 RepID=UPI00359F0A02
MPQMIKLAVFDLDGTLLNQHKQLSPRTKRIVNQLLDQRCLLAVATSRPPWLVAPIDPIFRRFSIMIYYNGGKIVDQRKQEEINTYLDRVSVKQFLLTCQQRLPLQVVVIESKQGTYATMDIPDEYKEGLFITEGAYPIINDLEGVDCYKLLLPTSRKCDLQELQEPFRYVFDFTYTQSGMLLEVIPKGINKGDAIMKVIAEEGISPSDVIVFGDDYNDVEMLSMFDCSYAMENGIEEAKEAATYMAGHHAEDGVAKVLERLGG